MAMSLSIGLAGGDAGQDRFRVSKGAYVNIDVPEYSDADIKKAARDAELLAEMLKAHPAEMKAIINQVRRGETAEAQKRAAAIGLREVDFARQGGGLWALVIGIGIAAAVLLSHD